MLFLSMLGTGMLYGSEIQTTKSGYKSGFISISSEEVFNGLMVNLLTFPMVFLIVFLFKYSKPRYLRENRIVRAITETQDENDNDIDSIISGDGEEHSVIEDNLSETDDNISNVTDNISLNESIESEMAAVKNTKFSLPFFCSYIGWVISLVCILVSVFFLWVFGIIFGNDVVYKWLTAFLISFFTSFFIFEPIKVRSLLYIYFNVKFI